MTRFDAAKIVYFFELCKFFFPIRPNFCILKQKSSVRDWKGYGIRN